MTFAEWRNQELPLPGGGAARSTTRGTRTRSRCAPRSSTSVGSPTGAAASPSSARWPSSATTATRRTARSRARSTRSASTCSSRSASSRASTAGVRVADADEAIALLRDELEARRLRARQRRARPRPGTGRRGTRRRDCMTRVFIAGIVAGLISIIAGPRFIDFLRRKELGQQIREEGPERHVVKQGTPTAGGILILVRGVDRVLRVLEVRADRADRVLRHARLRRDRLPRRLHQVHAQALARSVGPVEAAAARRVSLRAPATSRTARG